MTWVIGLTATAGLLYGLYVAVTAWVRIHADTERTSPGDWFQTIPLAAFLPTRRRGRHCHPRTTRMLRRKDT